MRYIMDAGATITDEVSLIQIQHGYMILTHGCWEKDEQMAGGEQ
jgi:hypothetical protein